MEGERENDASRTYVYDTVYMIAGNQEKGVKAKIGASERRGGRMNTSYSTKSVNGGKKRGF